MTILDQIQQEGDHELVVDLGSLPPGMYLCVMQTGQGKVVEKIIKVGSMQ
mgnify:CR=1 FL=1